MRRPKGSAETDTAPSWHHEVPVSFIWTTMFGLLVIAAAIGGFVSWGTTATLDSAVIARGSFVAVGNNRVVQHLEGGIIRDILVREGQAVTAGQVLLRLDSTAAGSELRRLRLRRYRLLATANRLAAEKLALQEPQFVDELILSVEPEVQAIINGQRSEFSARHAMHQSEADIIQQRIAAVEQEISGLRAQHEATVVQIDLTGQQITPLQQLYDQGHARLPQLLEIKRLKSKLEGEAGELVARMGQARQRILELRSQLMTMRVKITESAVAEIQKVENELADIEQRIRASEDILARVDIRAPVDGIVVRMAHHTSGGVVTPGQEIMTILPEKEELLIEAYVRPDNIEAVKEGNRASFSVLAIKSRAGHMVDGEVIYVSADAIQQRDRSESFYVIRIRPADDERSYLTEHRVAAGMPVEVFVATGERTFYEYLVEPIRASFRRAFTES